MQKWNPSKRDLLRKSVWKQNLFGFSSGASLCVLRIFLALILIIVTKWLKTYDTSSNFLMPSQSIIYWTSFSISSLIESPMSQYQIILYNSVQCAMQIPHLFKPSFSFFPVVQVLPNFLSSSSSTFSLSDSLEIYLEVFCQLCIPTRIL